MGRAERKRWADNDRVCELLEESDRRNLTAEELAEIRARYTGQGGLVASRWDNGQYFTPSLVTKFVIDLLGIHEESELNILEPSCGGGAFLEHLPFASNVTGIEQMHQAAKVSGLLHPTARIHAADALSMNDDLAGRFDVVVGNPPFGPYRRQDDHAGFEATIRSGKLEWAFIELALNALRPGGVMALVVPDGILGNSKDTPYRKWLLGNYWLHAVISLPELTFKPTGTTVKTSVLVVQKPYGKVEYSDAKDGGRFCVCPFSDGVFMAVCSEIGWDSRLRPTGKCDLPKILDAWQKRFPNGLAHLKETADVDSYAIPLPEETVSSVLVAEGLVKEERATGERTAEASTVARISDARVSVTGRAGKNASAETHQLSFDFTERAA